MNYTSNSLIYLYYQTKITHSGFFSENGPFTSHGLGLLTYIGRNLSIM